MIIDVPDKVILKYKDGRTLVLSPEGISIEELYREVFFVNVKCYIYRKDLDKQQSLPEKDKA